MPNNEPLSSLTHLIGALLSIAALVLMIAFAAIHGTVSLVVGASIFGSSLILLYIASAIYHFTSKNHPKKALLQKLDHIMIYILIAGTYTPITLTLESRAWGWSLFGVIWGLALIGISIKVISKKTTQIFSTILYLAMGWLLLIPAPLLTSWFDGIELLWLFLGGGLYTFGVLFFILDYFDRKQRWFGGHEIFHLFVLAGSFCHFWLVLLYL